MSSKTRSVNLVVDNRSYQSKGAFTSKGQLPSQVVLYQNEGGPGYSEAGAGWGCG